MKTTIATVIAFGANGDAARYQRGGWSVPEDGFAWTLDDSSTLELPAVDAPFGFFVELQLNPLIRPAIPRQRLILSVDGITIGTEEIRHSGLYAFYCPPSQASTASRLLTIDHPDFYRGLPTERCTAFAVSRVRILPLSEPATPRGHMESKVPVVEAGDAERVSGSPIADLVVGFEMLAGNCEFGGVQRHFGAEPLGLLRFAGASPEAAVQGLEEDFLGMGNDLDAIIADNHIAEWMIIDRRYRLRFHSMCSSRDLTLEQVLKRERTKIAFLRRKFVEDLSGPYKTFIFSDLDGLPLSGAMPLFLALSRKADHTLLWIAEDKDRAGLVTEIYPGLLKGHIERFGADASPVGISGWLAILTNAVLLRKAVSSTPEPAQRNSATPWQAAKTFLAGLFNRFTRRRAPPASPHR